MATVRRLRRIDYLDGQDLKEAFAAGTRCLERYCNAINALNVFPVPDGDTGTNMLLTMRSADEQAHPVASPSAGTVARSIARGALLGARGNSGVILSQFLLGFAQALENTRTCDAKALAQALTAGSQAAYTAVTNPVEGTMLTVMRGLSKAAEERATKGEANVTEVWTAALEEAEDVLSRTPMQLPILREAGVVDAGGQGVLVLLKGGLCSLLGNNVDQLELEVCIPIGGEPAEIPTVKESYLAATEEERYGYCTQFIVEGQDLDLEELRKRLSELADSTVVIGDQTLVKVHVHTFDPQSIISYATSLGTTTQVLIDNIDHKHQGFVALHRQPRRLQELAVVAVAWGEGFVRLFQDLGCHAVVRCGRTMNPSAQELLDAARSTEAKEVVVLPNNPNVVATARQAASMAEGGVRCIPSTTIPQGIAALLSYSPEEPPEKVLQAMEASLCGVKTLEVTTSVRPVTMSGVQVAKGQYIGLVDGKLVVAGDSSLGVLRDSLIKTGIAEGSLVTLYWGGDTQESEALEAAERIKKIIHGVEVEVVHGGQLFYHYIASIE